MIVGIGIDLVEVARVERVLERHGQRFVRRVFTETEQQECAGRVSQAMHYAVRFAAKEAFLKAVGLGLRGGMRWRDVGVVHAPSGKPSLEIRGRAFDRMCELGADSAHVSLTHTDAHACAVVILEKSKAEPRV
ncbi:holo-ACP synthase [Candidatus Sumerlaeota bacterium]|nr:holo-ACP synthase [Candidatus Sumerlaeota bacterium]